MRSGLRDPFWTAVFIPLRACLAKGTVSGCLGSRDAADAGVCWVANSYFAVGQPAKRSDARKSSAAVRRRFRE